MTTPQRLRTVAQKMGLRPALRAHLVGAPTSALATMDLPQLHLCEELCGEFDYLHLFATRQEQMRETFPPLRDRLRTGGMLWVSWPKGGQLGTDLTMRSVIAIGYELNMVESICLRIDETWAGLKFTRPRPGVVYANSYGTLPGEPARGARAVTGR